MYSETKIPTRKDNIDTLQSINTRQSVSITKGGFTFQGVEWGGERAEQGGWDNPPEGQGSVMGTAWPQSW